MRRHPEPIQPRVALPAIALAAAILSIGAPGARAAGRCAAPTRHPFPPASGLTVSHTNCATGRAVVEYVQAWWQLNGTLPGWLKARVHGHRWHCTYRAHRAGSSKAARCTSGRRVVKMTLH
jgi:hypothetical protein